MEKFYWILCGIMLIVGIGIGGSNIVPLSNTDSGEMPPAFGVGVDIALLAIIGFIGGVAAKAILSFLKKKSK